MELHTEHRTYAAELYQLHARALVGFAASIVGSADAEDVVSSVAGRLFESDALASANDKKAYLYQAVLNAARSHLRSESRRIRRERKLALDRARIVDWYTPGPDLTVALDVLSPRQRAVVHLTYWEDLRGIEVAERLDISEGSVRTHLARAKKVLKELIK